MHRKDFVRDRYIACVRLILLAKTKPTLANLASPIFLLLILKQFRVHIINLYATWHGRTKTKQLILQLFYNVPGKRSKTSRNILGLIIISVRTLRSVVAPLAPGTTSTPISRQSNILPKDCPQILGISYGLYDATRRDQEGVYV